MPSIELGLTMCARQTLGPLSDCSGTAILNFLSEDSVQSLKLRAQDYKIAFPPLLQNLGKSRLWARNQSSKVFLIFYFARASYKYHRDFIYGLPLYSSLLFIFVMKIRLFRIIDTMQGMWEKVHYSFQVPMCSPTHMFSKPCLMLG